MGVCLKHVSTSCIHWEKGGGGVLTGDGGDGKNPESSLSSSDMSPLGEPCVTQDRSISVCVVDDSNIDDWLD